MPRWLGAKGPWPAAALALILVASATLHLWGIERNLPDGREVDEDALLRPALRIVATGNLNPRWFGYPGSTVIYPLAGLLHVQQAAFHGGSWLAPNPRFRFAFFAGDFAPHVRTGRLLSSAYGVASVAMAAWIAALCCGAWAGVVAAALATFSPVAIAFAQPLRSDSAAAFFGLLFLALVLRALDAPTARRQILAGLALGLAIASRYMMASVGIALLVAQLHLWRTRRDDGTGLARAMAAAWLAVPAGFLAVTPYFLLDARGAIHGLLVGAQKQSAHVGIDQLGLLGNLSFYFTDAIPGAVGVPTYALAVLGAAVLFRRRRMTLAVLASYVLGFALGVSLLGIHWQRWIIPLLPVLSVLAAVALVVVADAAGRLVPRWRHALRAAVLVAATLATTAGAARQTVVQARHNARPSTEILALEWVLANIPPRSRIAFEWYTAPLTTSKRARRMRYDKLSFYSLSRRPLHFYVAQGYEYALVSSNMYNRYLRQPERYPKEAGFYERLKERATLVHEVRALPGRRGPNVGIYRLPQRKARRVDSSGGSSEDTQR